MVDEKKAKRLAFKDYKKLKRLARNLDKRQREHRDWCEEQADALGCYVDRWIPRVGFYTDDEGKRVKVPDEVTKAARARHTALANKLDEINHFVDRLSEKHGTFPDLIDIKTGKVTFPTEGVLDAMPEDGDKAEGKIVAETSAEKPAEETSEPDALGVGAD